MKFILTLLVVLVSCHQSNAETCTQCNTNYGNKKTECPAITTYIKCLYVGTGTDCKTQMIAAEKDRAGVPCELTDTCTCQFALKRADVSTSQKNCTEHQKELHCLSTAKDVGCDGAMTKIDSITASEKATKQVPSCSLTDTCKCQVNFGKADVGDNTKKCNELKKELSCLAKSFSVGCDGKTTRSAVSKTVDSALSQLNPCMAALSETCKCEKKYAVSDVTNKENMCTAAKDLQTCLTNVKNTKDTGCDGNTLKDKVKTEVADKAVKDKCTLSETCKCENKYAAADVTNKENMCTAAKDLQTCLTKVKVATDTGCDGKTLKDKVKKDVADKAVNDKCSGASMLSQMTVFTFVMLLFSMLFKN